MGEEESTWNILIMGELSTVAEDVRYLNLSLSGSIRKRLLWPLMLVVLASRSGNVPKLYSGVVQGIVVLPSFIPILLGTGGNVAPRRQP